MHLNKSVVMIGLFLTVGLGLDTLAYLPPVEERAGVKVEIGSFPQKTERTGKNPYSWPLGVTEVKAGAPRSFPVTLENRTDKTVSGMLAVWMNDDWDVAGPQGPVTLAPREKRTFDYSGVAKARALDALYPVHARFRPEGVAETEAPHPIAVFKFLNPDAPRTTKKIPPPVLGKGVYRLDEGFTRTVSLLVKGQVIPVPEADRGRAAAWGAHMTAQSVRAGGTVKKGYSSHPPYRQGAGFIRSDYAMTLPQETPISLHFANFLGSHGKEAPSDGVEYTAWVLQEGVAPVRVCGHLVTKELVWQEVSGDLTPWAGRKITLRLETGPGPKMNTCCDGGGWGDVCLKIGPQPAPPTEEAWQARAEKACALARAALTESTDAAAGRYHLEAADGCYGAGVAPGPRGLEDGVIAFSDGARCIAYRGFDVRVDTGDANPPPVARANIRAEKGTLRISWCIPGQVRSAEGFPRISDLAVGPSSEKLHRVYAGFGNVIENPRDFVLDASGFALSTRHVGADYANGLSVVQATDVPPDRLTCDGAKNVFALHAHHDATFTFAPSVKGAFAAARSFRAVAGYRPSAGHAKLGARMCLDQWGGNYRKAAEGLEKAARYGLTNTVFVKHAWQRWGYDYRLPEIYPPADDPEGFGVMREACRRADILFVPHDNYTDIYPDAENYSYDLVVFNLDGTPQRAWFNPGRHALSYRWAPHAFRPWCLRNAKLLKGGYDPDGVFIDVLTAHGPFDYLDRQGRFHDKMETSRAWADAYDTYREGYRRPDAVCISEAGQDHLVGTLDAGQSDHFSARKWFGARQPYGDAERAPWHDIVTHGFFVLFSGGLGGRYQENDWHQGGDRALHGYGSDDYFSTAFIGGRNPMCDGPFSRDAVKTYWLQHDSCAELARAEFLDLQFGPNIHCQHAFFSDDSEVWINRQTNAVWRLPNGVVLPSYGSYVKTPRTESGVVEKDGVRCAFARGPAARFYDARMPAAHDLSHASVRTTGAKCLGRNQVQVDVAWKTIHAIPDYAPFVHVTDEAEGRSDAIVFQGGYALTPAMRTTPGDYTTKIDVVVPDSVKAGDYYIRYGLWRPRGGGRLLLAGARPDAVQRMRGGKLTVTKEKGRVTRVAWTADEGPDSLAERDRLLGVNRAGRAVAFGEVTTDGTFRLLRHAASDKVEWTIVPLPGVQGFTATFDLKALDAADGTVTNVVPVDPEKDAAAPTWSRTGDFLTVTVDAKSFAYGVSFARRAR